MCGELMELEQIKRLWRTSLYLIRLTFFGLDTRLRVVWMDEIFYLVRHGNGGFSYLDCYNMPTQIRKYNVRKLNHEITQENEKLTAAKKGETTPGLDKLITGKHEAPVRKPDYVSKASRK